MENCRFCDESRLKKRFIDESKYSFVILSNPALVKGHCLVIPKRHVEKISELNYQERGDLFSEIIKMQELLLKKFSGCDIRQNYRPFQKEDDLKVNHLHFHLQPREFEDKLCTDCQIYEKKFSKN